MALLETFNFYRSFIGDAAHAPPLATLADACLVVDVLGDDVKSVGPIPARAINLLMQNRNIIVERYCSIELKEYRRIFRANDEVYYLNFSC